MVGMVGVTVTPEGAVNSSLTLCLKSLPRLIEISTSRFFPVSSVVSILGACSVKVFALSTTFGAVRSVVDSRAEPSDLTVELLEVVVFGLLVTPGPPGLLSWVQPAKAANIASAPARGRVGGINLMASLQTVPLVGR